MDADARKARRNAINMRLAVMKYSYRDYQRWREALRLIKKIWGYGSLTNFHERGTEDHFKYIEEFIR